MSAIAWSAELIEAFAGTFLSPMYDEAKPTPDLHREGWGLYCSAAKLAAIAAPREHAKSTAFTHDYTLANVLFRQEDYVILVSANEEMAIEHLSDIAKELRDNEDLIKEFRIKRFVVDAKTDIIVEMDDGHQFRIIARGSGQKMRGRKWRGKRPGLIVCDDLEDDEQVESLDRRIKFRRWFFRALKPALRDGGKLRVHGTILHEDSLLARLMKDRTWTTLFYKAHAGFDDFTDILWPEKFPESRLRDIRQTFIEQGDAPGYSQEYLNDPFDNSEAYLRRADFIAMDEADRREPKIFCAGVDFAISKADKANRTSITVGGKCTRNLISVVDQRKGRWDSLEIMDEMIAVQQRWGIDVWFVENGQIWKAISPMLYREMQRRDVWLNIFALNPVKDKAVRGRPYQAKHRAGGMRFDKEADWYPSYEAENLRFTGTGDAAQDDQFDSTALMVKGFDQLADIDEEDFQSDEEAEMIAQDPRNYEGRNAVTGY